MEEQGQEQGQGQGLHLGQEALGLARALELASALALAQHGLASESVWVLVLARPSVQGLGWAHGPPRPLSARESV